MHSHMAQQVGPNFLFDLHTWVNVCIMKPLLCVGGCSVVAAGALHASVVATTNKTSKI